MIYFCFASFSMNEVTMEKISSDGRVETMCRVVSVFLMAFINPDPAETDLNTVYHLETGHFSGNI